MVLSNDSGSYGKEGYRFPRTFNGVNPEGVEYIADIYAVLPDDRRVIFEFDGIKAGQGHHSTFAYHRDQRRDAFFATFGVATTRFNTGDVSRLKLTEADLMAEVDYRFKQLRKALLPTPNPLLTK